MHAHVATDRLTDQSTDRQMANRGDKEKRGIKQTLNAICSRKCATPLFFSVSNLLPASIQRPT